MDKGIRVGVNAKFNEMLPQLAIVGGKKFRRELLDWTVEQYGATMAAASTHYNFAFKECKKVSPELVLGLGRAEGKNNGGRKRKEVTVVSKTGEIAVVTVEDTKAVEEDTVTLQTLFVVKKVKDGTVVAENLSIKDAMGLVARAAAQKKAKLFYV